MTARSRLLVGLAALIACSACSSGTRQGGQDPETMTLLGSESTIWFVGIKNNAVAVPGSFAALEGALDVVGHRGWIEVGIASIATGNAERDQSIAMHLFGSAEYPKARFAIKDALGATELPAVGESVELEVSGILTLRGVDTVLTLPARFTRESVGRIRVQTLAPVVLTAEQLQLGQAFQVLQAVCGHEALSRAVPLSFDLVFAEGGA